MLSGKHRMHPPSELSTHHYSQFGTPIISEDNSIYQNITAYDKHSLLRAAAACLERTSLIAGLTSSAFSDWSLTGTPVATAAEVLVEAVL